MALGSNSERDMKFLVVEDHPLYACALESVIISSMPGVQVVLASTIAESKTALEGGSYALVLLDLWLPDSNGFEGLIELRMRRPSVPVVVISAFTEPDVIHHSIACGAAGFIPKSATKDALVRDLREVLAGNVPMPEKYQPPPTGDSPETEALRSKLDFLTQQQLRVLQMMCQGLLNKQIAHELGIGETTVKAHVSEILRKFGVCSRTQAVLGVARVPRSADIVMGLVEDRGRPLQLQGARKQLIS